MHVLAFGDAFSEKMQKDAFAYVEKTGLRESTIEFCEK
jgi:hypothetical protein